MNTQTGRIRSFMERRVQSGKSIRGELALVIVIGLLGAIGGWIVGTEAIAVAGDRQQNQLINLALVPIGGALVLWGLYGIGAHLAANRIYGSKQPLIPMLRTAAWAMIPIGLANLGKSIIDLVVFPSVTVPAPAADAPRRSTDEVFTLFIESGLDDPLYLLVPIGFLVAIGLTAYLMTHAIGAAKDISYEESLRVAGGLAAIHVIFTIWQAIEFGLLG